VFDLIVYEQPAGQRPFDKWFDGLRDKRAQSRIFIKLRQVQAGNFGDCKPVGEGVLELRIDIGLGIAFTVGASDQNWSFSFAEATNRVNLRTSNGPKSFGRTGNGDLNEKVRERHSISRL
jgi:putative addiction module killer protein